MSEVRFTSDVQVELIDHMGSDLSLVRAARVSTGTVAAVGAELSDRDRGLINYLLRERHGSPAEQTAMTFYVRAPIFVVREFQRHRMFSFNEVSGRYSVLEPEFYVPSEQRPVINGGSSARPELVEGDDYQQRFTGRTVGACAVEAWNEYDLMIKQGIANEVARMVLPLNIMTSMYATCNARSLMHFLSLRTQDARATFTSRPQLEIQYVARKMEDIFARLFPVTYAAFNDNGRVAP